MARPLAAPDTRRIGARPAASHPQPWMTAGAALIGVVLRWWSLGASGLSGDEMFTGAYAQLPIGDIPGWLATHDTHPPLDYILRHPFALESRSAFALRSPSAIFATLTVVLVWWWMRKRGWYGFAVILLTSLSSFELLYGRTARAYALLVLCGTAVAVLAERWLERPERRYALGTAAVLLIALFTDTTALLLVLGVVVLPLARQDRQAWWWRGASLVALAVWLIGWGPSVYQQYQLDRTTWVPLVSPETALIELGRLASVMHPVLAVVSLPLLGFGLLLLWLRERRLAIVALVLSVLPIFVAMALGLRLHIWLARSLASTVWFVPVALAGVLEWCRDRGRVYMIGGATLIGIVVVPSSVLALTYEEDVARTARTLAAVARPGDAVVGGQERDTGNIFQWTLGTSLERQPLRQHDDPRTYTSYVPGAPFTGRIWVVTARAVPYAPPGLVRCATPDPPGDEELAVQCWQMPPP
ncbi:MAG: glycosyltransferase family 39 protein [Actinobacteria bacterium]|nr:glycosyltransferase family 39 protein [Actinomycetota bacterium]